MDNDDLYKTFVQTCEKVKDTLKNKYGDGWTDPSEGPPPKMQEEDDWDLLMNDD